MTVIALDVYGTLINPQAVVGRLRDHIGSAAGNVAVAWRTKQLEYTFRRAAMDAYEDFSVVTAQALDFAIAVAGLSLSEQPRKEILAHYLQLDAFADVPGGLQQLQASGHSLHAFSNGHPDDLTKLLSHAGLGVFLESVVSVHDVRSFKPAPKVYAHFNQRVGADAEHTWLVSSNPFDISGAAAFGWKTAWVRRSPEFVFDAWNGPPTVTITSLAELDGALANA